MLLLYFVLNSILMGNVARVNTGIFNLPLDDKRNTAAGVCRMGAALWSFFEKQAIGLQVNHTDW